MPTKHPFRTIFVVMLVVLAGAAGVWFLILGDPSGNDPDIPLWTVRSRTLDVRILEEGTLEALSSHTVQSQVEGRASILFIVDEGTVITEQDVAEEKLLVELDSSGIKEKLDRHRLDLASARTATETAASSLDIQRQQNLSDIRKAELEVRFAILDIERYIGRDLATDLLERYGPVLDGSAPAPPVNGEGDAGDAAPDAAFRRDVATLLENELLEGEAMQRIRDHLSDIGLAEEEYERARGRLAWSEKLKERGFVSNEELVADRIALQRSSVELERARIARNQFKTYDFPKEVERLLSGVVEAQGQLERTRKRTHAAEAKALADLSNRQEQEQLQDIRYKKLEGQLDHCRIVATRPGLVVYASSRRRGRWDSGDRIRKGGSVQERQSIISIPDLASLGVKVDVHESVVKRVSIGSPVQVSVAALKGRVLEGVVKTVARLPSSEDSWLNPNRRVYPTEIALNDPPADVRPGMGAEVEILVASLEAVLSVPNRAVTGPPDRPTVWVMRDGAPVELRVALGLSNDSFVEVRAGLVEGDVVLLAPPRSKRLMEEDDEDDAEDGDGKKPPIPAGVPGDAGRPSAQPGSPGGRPGGGRRPGGGGRPKRAGSGGGSSR